MTHAIILSPLMGTRLAPGVDVLALGSWDEWTMTVRAAKDSDRSLISRHPDYLAPARCGTVAGLRDSPVWIVIESATFPGLLARLEAVKSAEHLAATAPLYVTVALRLAAPGWTGAGPWALVVDPDEPTFEFLVDESGAL